MPSAAPPFRLRTPVVAAGLTLLIVLVHAWMCTLEFQLDDYEQVAQAENLGGPAVLLGHDTDDQVLRRGHATVVKFYRPLLHLSFWSDFKVFGARPAAFHAMSIAWHALATVLFFIAMLRVFPTARRGTCAFVAAVFAVHPGKWGSISWIAARGDILMTAAFLAAVIMAVRWRRGGRRLDLAFMWCFMLSALAAKEGAVVVPLLLALIDMFVIARFAGPREWQRRIWSVLPIVAVVPAYLLLRKAMFGDAANYYAGAARIMTSELMQRMLGDLRPVFGRLVGGYFHFAESDWRAVLGQSLAGVCLILSVVWAVRRPWQRLPFLGFLAVSLSVAFVPPLRLYREASGFDASRLFYLPGLYAAAFIALPLTGIAGRLRVVRVLALLLGAWVITVWVMSGIEHIRSQFAAAEVVRRVRQDLHAVVATTGRRDVLYLAMDVPTDIRHVPTYGTFLSYAFLPPFVERPIYVRAIINVPAYVGSGELQTVKALAQALSWRAGGPDGGHLIPVTGILPEMQDRRPTFKVDENRAPVTFDPPLSPRDISALEVEFAAPPAAPCDMVIRLEDEHGQVFEIPFTIDPSHGTLTKLILPITDPDAGRYRRDAGFLFLGALVRVEFVLTRGEDPRIVSFGTDGKLSEIGLTSPIRGQRVPAAGDEPLFVFEDRDEFSVFRLRLTMPALSWTLPRRQLMRLEDGRLGFRLSMQGIGPGEVPRFWTELTRHASVLGRQGVDDLALSWFVEGLSGQLDYAQGRSAVAKFLITR